MQKVLLSFTLLLFIYSCSDHQLDPSSGENPASFSEIGTIDIGDIGAAEISATIPLQAAFL